MQLCIILRHAPYDNSLSQEALELALASAAFDVSVSLVFLGDGILQLLAQQDGTLINRKNHLKALASLPLYDIENCYISNRDLNQLTLSKCDLIDQNLSLVSDDEIANIIANADTVVSF